MKTIDEIYREMLAVFSQETGMALSGAGEQAVRMYALAAQIYGLYQEAEWVRKQCFPQTAAGEDLDRHAFLRGLSRREATRAEGTLQFSVNTAAARDIPIPAGTVCVTAGLAAFETTETRVLPAGATWVEVPARAVEPGTGGNAAARTIRSMTVAPAGMGRFLSAAVSTENRRVPSALAASRRERPRRKAWLSRSSPTAVWGKHCALTHSASRYSP